MTLYTRGYRPYDRAESDGGGRGRGPRFGPILLEGWRDARRGKAYRALGVLILIVTTVHGFLLYFQSNALMRAVERGVGRRAAEPGEWLQATMASFHSSSWAFVVLLTLFVGCGLIADDLRSRALPLYISRPITPFDYYLGKLLIPICVMASLVLLPMLALVLVAVLFRPTEEMFSFLSGQGRMLGAIAAYFAVTALAYSSLVLLYSAWTSRRISAVILGAVTLLGGEMVRNSCRRLTGDFADVLRATSLVGDTKVVLFRAMGRNPSLSGWAGYPSTSAALLAIGVVVVVAAAVVLRRARSVEVAG